MPYVPRSPLAPVPECPRNRADGGGSGGRPESWVGSRRACPGVCMNSSRLMGAGEKNREGLRSTFRAALDLVKGPCHGLDVARPVPSPGVARVGHGARGHQVRRLSWRVAELLALGGAGRPRLGDLVWPGRWVCLSRGVARGGFWDPVRGCQRAGVDPGGEVEENFFDAGDGVRLAGPGIFSARRGAWLRGSFVGGAAGFRSGLGGESDPQPE